MNFSLQSILDFIRGQIEQSEQAGALISYLSAHPLTMMIIILAAGVLTCFFGYKFFRLITALCGAAVGAFIGFLISNLLSKKIENMDARISLGIIIVLGLIGLFSAFKLVKSGIFAACAYLTYRFIAPLCAGIISGFVQEKTGFYVSVMVVSVVLGVIAGLLSLILTKLTLTVCTAVGGGYIVAEYASLIALSSEITQTINNTVVYIIAAVLALLGLLVQFKINAKSK